MRQMTAARGRMKPVLRRIWHVGLPAGVLALALAVSILHPEARSALRSVVPGFGSEMSDADCILLRGGPPCAR